MGSIGTPKTKENTPIVQVEKTKSVPDIVHEAENGIRDDKTETAIVFDSEGNILLKKGEGKTSSVSFTPDESKLFADAIFTHNHPSGSTFSEADLKTALTAGVREMRACHKSGAYVLKRTFEIGQLVPAKYKDFYKDYTKAFNKYKKTIVDHIWESSEQTLKDANDCNNMLSEFRKDWLRTYAKDYGWEYTEESL